MYEKTKEFSLENFRQNPRFKTFPDHYYFVEASAMRFCDFYPEADKEAVKLAVWLHDIGNFVKGEQENDHAVVSEREAKKFLAENDVPVEMAEKVLHAVRSHRNKDVTPATIEAKIVAAADSASHLVGDGVFTYILRRYGKEYTMGKLERDWRDLNILPEAGIELKDLYKSWKEIIENYPEWKWDDEIGKTR
jgi:HD superfamily phosphodiesterase